VGFAAKQDRPRAWLEAYYSFGTLGFAALDALFGANVRAVGLAGHPELRAGWYALCLGCFALARLRPAWAELAGLAEAMANLLLLVLSVFLPYLALADAVSRGDLLGANPFAPAFLTNFVISSAVAVALFPGTFLPVRPRARAGR
jgi:hypothetical protein